MYNVTIAKDRGLRVAEAVFNLLGDLLTSATTVIWITESMLRVIPQVLLLDTISVVQKQIVHAMLLRNV